MLFIRVLAQNAHNKYTVSYNGGRFSLSSNVSLKVGDAFLVKIKSSADKIELVPVKHEPVAIATGQNVSEKIPVSLLSMTSQNISPEISMYLNSLGITADAVFLQIFLQMRSLGMKIDASLMQKIWRVAKQFAGQEKAAADVAVALEHKGISADVKTVAALMGAFSFGAGTDNDSKNYFIGENFHGKKDNDDEKTDSHVPKYNASEEVFFDDDVISAQKIKEFFLELLDSKSEGNNEFGILSLFNSIDMSQKNAKSDCFVLPFEFSVSDDTNRWSGNLRLLHGAKEKKLQ